MDSFKIKVVLIAKSLKQAKEAKTVLLSDDSKFQVTTVFPGVPFSHDQFDCGVACAFKESEIRFLADQIAWYNVLPVFITVGAPDTLSIQESKDGRLGQRIIEEIKLLDEKLFKSFEVFDLKKNGKISLKDLPKIIRGAGFQLTEEAFALAQIQLDLNGDGRIEYKEFRQWWLSGHRGKTGVAGFVIKNKAAMLRFARKLQPQIQEILKAVADKNQKLEYTETKCTLSLNPVLPENVKTRVNAKFTAFSSDAQVDFQNILRMHPKFTPKTPERSHHIWCFCTDQNPSQVITLENLIPIADFIGKFCDIPVSVFADAQQLSIAIFWDSRALGSAKFLENETIKMFRSLGIEQSIELDLLSCFDAIELLDNESEQELETLPRLLLRGVQVGLKTKLCREFAPFILDIFNEASAVQKIKRAEKKEQNSNQMDGLVEDTIQNGKMPLFPFVEFYAALASLCQMKGNLTLNIDRAHYDDAVKNNPYFPQFDMSAQAYLQRLTQSASDDQTIDAMGKELGLPAEISSMLKKFVNKRVKVQLCDGQTSAQFSLETDGIQLLLKNLIRILATSDKSDEMAIW